MYILVFTLEFINSFRKKKKQLLMYTYLFKWYFCFLLFLQFELDARDNKFLPCGFGPSSKQKQQLIKLLNIFFSNTLNIFKEFSLRIKRMKEYLETEKEVDFFQKPMKVTVVYSFISISFLTILLKLLILFLSSSSHLFPIKAIIFKHTI